MIDFSCEALYEMVKSGAGHRVEGCVYRESLYETGTPTMFTIVGHELEGGIGLLTDKPILVITTLRSDTKLVRIGFDVVLTERGYDMRDCEIVSEEDIR